MTPQPWAPGPLVTRRRLGGELRRMREATGLKLDDVAKRLECSPSKISRLENGKGIPKSRDVRDILDVLGVDDDAERTRLMDWSRTGQAKMWWQDYADVIPQGTVDYVELEWDASSIDAYETHLVHGLLQTRDYARAVLENAWADIKTVDEIERLVEVRMRRQEALTPDHGLTFRCVLDESTLHRVVGTTATTRQQLEHLVALAEAQHVDIRVLPFSVGLRPGGRESFAVMTFPDGVANGIVYIERPDDSSYLQDLEGVAMRRAHMEGLLDVSLSEEQSVPLIRAAVQRLTMT